MSMCFDHGTTFPDTHRKISPDSHIYASKAIEPPRYGEGTFASFGPGGDVSQQMAKYQFSLILFDQSQIEGGTLASFRATQCW